MNINNHTDLKGLIKRLTTFKESENLPVYVRLDGKQYILTSVIKDEIDNGDNTGIVLNVTAENK